MTAPSARYDCAACGLSDEACAALLYAEGSDRGCCQGCAHKTAPTPTGTADDVNREGRRQTSDESIAKAFTEAWLNCTLKHDGTLVSGPCNECVVEYAGRLRDHASPAQHAASSVADPLDHWRVDTGGLRCPVASGLAVYLIDGECSACGAPATKSAVSRRRRAAAALAVCQAPSAPRGGS